MKRPHVLLPEQYQEYQQLKKKYESDLLFESIRSVSLEFDIDEPIKTCVMALALLECRPSWSCCGFNYEGQLIHKYHQYGRCYFILDNAERALSIYNTMVNRHIPYYTQWQVNPIGAGIDLHFDFKNVIPQWDDEKCIHYAEQASLYIAGLEQFLMSLSEIFIDSFEMTDSNQLFRGYTKHWQYPAKEPWTITKKDLLERA